LLLQYQKAFPRRRDGTAVGLAVGHLLCNSTETYKNHQQQRRKSNLLIFRDRRSYGHWIHWIQITAVQCYYKAMSLCMLASVGFLPAKKPVSAW